MTTFLPSRFTLLNHFVLMRVLILSTILYACDSEPQATMEPSFNPAPLPDQSLIDQNVLTDIEVPDHEILHDLSSQDLGVQEPSACSNELDDDDDGLVDYPYDPGCASADDPDESNQTMIDSMMAQCNNELDDDGDGYADLADPDCRDLNDQSEAFEGEAQPACHDGIDNDGDGRIDAFEDLGCSHFGDLDELDVEGDLPACANLIDDDRDGLIDYPFDPGCIAPGDQSEIDPLMPTACRDGIDNDDDGLIDFPADPGCESASSLQEQPICMGSARVIEAQLGMRYTATSAQGRHTHQASCGGRGAPDLTLFYRLNKPIRRLIFHSEGTWETTLSARPRCAEGFEYGCIREVLGDGGRNTLVLENPQPGAYYVTVDGASAQGGEVTLWVEEEPIEACQDGIDNDGDGFIDAPFDPGCIHPSDEDESTPEPIPSCGDRIDNDGDGSIDYPDDRGCYQASDPSEEDECGRGVRVLPLGGTYPLTVVDTSSTPEQTSEMTGSCGQSQGFEAVYIINNPSHARFSFSLIRSDGMSDQVSIYVRSGNCLSGAELGCASDILEFYDLGEELPQSAILSLDILSAPQGPLFLVIDHPLDGLPYELTIDRTELPPRCRDELDNDSDGLIDQDDPGCEDPDDESELDPQQATACHDLIDNDADGHIDHPYDPGCLYRGGLSEVDPDFIPSCSNGLDDNADGYIDFPYDPGCSSRADEIEAVSAVEPECFNGFDDDGDGVIDFPEDLGCTARGDRSEVKEQWKPHCSDGLDNDGDGLFDFPFDPQCPSRGTRSERNESGLIPICSNGEDDDFDGITDFPFEPGCQSAADDTEEDPDLLPLCANHYDDDGNGRIDWPDDPGCIYSADATEAGVDDPNPRCSDGVDNDLDGLIDLADPGCERPSDDDEMDLNQINDCSDDIDNDGDGFIDWPLDTGCTGAGDACEQGGFLRCTEGNDFSCVDVLSNPNHCGACHQSCAANIPCIQGFCAGKRPLRSEVLRCIYTARSPEDFLVGPLHPNVTETALDVLVRCTPNENSQALLLPRNSTNTLERNQIEIRRYVEQGGTLITERGRALQVYELITGIQVALLEQEYGACEGNPMPVIQRLSHHPIWALAPYTTPLSSETGCGVDLSLLPGVVDLGGWTPSTSSISYLDYGLGRVWFVEADWTWGPDEPSNSEEAGLFLMAAMIHGVDTPRHPLLPECADGIDNDFDSVVDLWDLDCQNREDVSESNSFDYPPILHDPNALMIDKVNAIHALGVACRDGLDNDGNGLIDFPHDPGCEAMGDLSEEALAEPPACDDGLDNDGDGKIDWPDDPGCSGKGARQENAQNEYAPCFNERDEDRDGLIDWPKDPDCLSPQSPGELKNALKLHPMSPELLFALYATGVSTRLACGNGIDDDADQEIDLNDPDCRTHFDLSEGEITNSSPPAQAEGSVCADGIDNDMDGALDWPNDLSCLTPFDSEEADECLVDTHLNLNELWEGSIQNPSPSDASILSACATPGGQMIIADVEHTGGTLQLNLRSAEDDVPVALSIRRNCDLTGEVTCLSAQDVQQQGGLSLPNARAGRYIITAHSLPNESWSDSQLPLNLSDDINQFQASHDLNARCWQDGGRNAFNCMGQINVHLGEDTYLLDMTEGVHLIELDGEIFVYDSQFIHQNIWRIRWIPPSISDLESRFAHGDLEIRGGLGAGVNTLSVQAITTLNESEHRYLYMTDSLNNPTTPPSLLWIVPSDPRFLNQITYQQNLGNLEAHSTLNHPLTIYITASYLSREALIGALKQRVVHRDLRLRSGVFGLTITSGDDL